MSVLKRVPLHLWNSDIIAHAAPLHLACLGPNTKAARALIANGADVDAIDIAGDTPAIVACEKDNDSVLELLVAGGADLTTPTSSGYTTLGVALRCRRRSCVQILIANGVRLKAARNHWGMIDEMRPFEQSVLRCRSTVAALLTAKRVAALHLWDRFLLCEIALQVWATRTDENGWSR